MKRTKLPSNIEYIYDVHDEPLILFKSSINKLLKEKDFAHLLSLYCLHYYAFKYQKTNLTTSYIANILNVNYDKAKELENTLVNLGFIGQITYYNHNKINIVRTGGRAGGSVLKEKNNKKESTFVLLLNMFDDKWKNNETFQKSIQDFIIHRKEKGKSLTPLACTRLANHLSQYKLPIVIQAIEKSIYNGWTGVFPESIETSKDNKYKPQYKEWEGRRYYLCPDGEYRNKAGSLFIE